MVVNGWSCKVPDDVPAPGPQSVSDSLVEPTQRTQSHVARGLGLGFFTVSKFFQNVVSLTASRIQIQTGVFLCKIYM